jgi:hypothetical protein
VSYDNKGKVSLWKNEQHEAGSSKPWVRGKAYAHRDIKAGEEMEIALWLNDSQNERAPKLTGKLSDSRPREQQRQQAPAVSGAAFNDDVPW